MLPLRLTLVLATVLLVGHAAPATAVDTGCRALVASEAPAADWLACTAALGDQALEDVRILSADDMQGREPGTPGSRKARDYIVSRLAAIGAEPLFAAYERPFRFRSKGKDRDGTNVIAVIPGTAGNSRTIVLTAHYDHFGTQDGQIYNGADDNASGVAGLLALAAALKADAPLHTTIIAFVDAEELGFDGSVAMVNDPEFPLADVALNLNLDMISKNAKGELYAAGGHYNEAVRALFEELAEFAPVKVLQGHDDPENDYVLEDWTSESDQIAFHDKGIPWIYFGVEDHPEYHEPTDDFATIDQPFFRGSIATAIAAYWMADERLTLLEGDAGD